MTHKKQPSVPSQICTLVEYIGRALLAGFVVTMVVAANYPQLF